MESLVVEHLVEIDGIPINYTEVGRGSHVIIFCCGLCGFAESDFGPILRKMDPSKFRVICPDPPGYGKSRPHDRDFRWGQYIHKDAKIYLKLLDASVTVNFLKIPKASVGGWSSGGMTAQLMAIFDPDRVTKLVFWGAFATADYTFIRFSRIFRSHKMFAPELRAVMLKAYGESYWQSMLDKWAVEVEAMYNRIKEQPLMALDTITCPTLILQGQMDGIIKDEQAQLCHAAIKNSKLILLPTGRHDLHLTHIDQFLPVVESFLFDGNS